MLHESWKAAKVQGQSFNRFDTERGVWHQTWDTAFDGKYVRSSRTQP